MHLGLPNPEKSLIREKLLVKLLNEIKDNADTIYFVGDLFDFWWEYKYVVPRGYVRFLGAVAEIVDSGTKVHFFTGNHDVWMKDYLEKELGVKVHTKELTPDISGKKFFIAHGDGLGPGDKGYKLLKKIFTNRFLQWCYSRLHPNFAFSLAKLWSHSRRKNEEEYTFNGEDKETLIQHSKDILRDEHYDYFIFGHRHYPLIIDLNESSKHVNIGDWLINYTYAKFDGTDLKLMSYKEGIIQEFITDLNKVQKINIF